MKTASSVERHDDERPRLADAHVPSRARLMGTFALLAAFWIASDAGYYWLLPIFGIHTSYNGSSVAIGAYYALWVALALVTFWPLYRTWWAAHENRLAYAYLTHWCYYAATVLMAHAFYTPSAAAVG